MSRRPRVICLMTSSLDGRLHPSRYSASPDGTTAEMAKGQPHPPRSSAAPPRPRHFARREGPFAIGLDPKGMGTYNAFLDLTLGIGSPALGMLAGHMGIGSVFVASAIAAAAAVPIVLALLRDTNGSRYGG